MRRWYVPLAVLGLGGIGVVLLSERGRSAVRAVLQKFGPATGRLSEGSDGLEDELNRILVMLDGVSESLGAHSEMGR